MAKKKNKSNSLTSNSFLSQIKLGESYTSLILGAIVVIVGVVLVLSFLKGKGIITQQTGSSATTQNENTSRTYLVKQGEDLWHIAQTLYGSGYNWTDLAQANNLSNPDVLFVGTKLTVPNVKPKEITLDVTQTQSVNTITGTSYTVEKGDYLWEIAVRAYGDGFKWVEIAKVNKLSNPDLIYSGNVLTLPR